jgi:hypothetical protein
MTLVAHGVSSFGKQYISHHMLKSTVYEKAVFSVMLCLSSEKKVKDEKYATPKHMS